MIKIAAHHLNKRYGVIIGDVVGLGKTLMATAVARIFKDDHGLETLIICPKNLLRLWERYKERYRLHAKVLSITRAFAELPECRRYRLVIVDESRNLRNREGYADRPRAVGHLFEDKDEAQEWLELHTAIRDARTHYQTGEQMPDWQALEGMLCRVRKP